MSWATVIMEYFPMTRHGRRFGECGKASAEGSDALGKPVIQLRVAMLAPSARRSSSRSLMTFRGPMLDPGPMEKCPTRTTLRPI